MELSHGQAMKRIVAGPFLLLVISARPNMQTQPHAKATRGATESMRRLSSPVVSAHLLGKIPATGWPNGLASIARFAGGSSVELNRSGLDQWARHGDTSDFNNGDWLVVHCSWRRCTHIPPERPHKRATVRASPRLDLFCAAAGNRRRSLFAPRMQLGALAIAPLVGISRRPQRFSFAS